LHKKLIFSSIVGSRALRDTFSPKIHQTGEKTGAVPVLKIYGGGEALTEQTYRLGGYFSRQLPVADTERLEAQQNLWNNGK
jgi:hypothetical protein